MVTGNVPACDCVCDCVFYCVCDLLTYQVPIYKGLQELSLQTAEVCDLGDMDLMRGYQIISEIVGSY